MSIDEKTELSTHDMRRLSVPPDALDRPVDDTDEAAVPFPLPVLRRSGVYVRSPFLPRTPAAAETAGDEAAGGIRTTFEELRVDVDGLHPTMTVSGTIARLFGGRLTWIARVAWDPARKGYTGSISYRDGVAALEPHTDVFVTVSGGWLPFGAPRIADVVYSGGGSPDSRRQYSFARSAFRTVGIEYDCASDATAVTEYDLRSHPNRPADLPDQVLTIEGAYSRLGIKMSRTGGDNVIPATAAGSNATWSDIEMHDAMVAHWSKWADVPQWQMWTLFAGQHDLGQGLGGIMFDDIGTAQRQGCAVFSNSFISQPPAGDPDAAAAVQRMRFWTAMHEIGHGFNLAHSWQKSLGTAWVPLADEPEARSFMNYPFFVNGGSDAFFADFAYRFSDDELLFLRHAPERLVQPGAAPWFDHHAFEQVRQASASTLTLTLRVNRPTARFAALEPVVAEVKFQNTSPVPQVVDRNALTGDGLTVVIKGDRREARCWSPFARYCYQPEPRVLQPGESLYAPVFLWAGSNGFDLAEPGRYSVYAALSTPAGDVLSAPLRLEILPADTREIDRLAPDVLTEEVGRVLAFGGSRGGSTALDRANDVLAGVVERMPSSPLGVHAAAALGSVAAAPGRVLIGEGSEQRFDVVDPDPDAARALLATAYADLPKAADTLGHIRLTKQAVGNAEALAATGAAADGAQIAGELATTLRDRGVRPAVVARVEAVAEQLAR